MMVMIIMVMMMMMMMMVMIIMVMAMDGIMEENYDNDLSRSICALIMITVMEMDDDYDDAEI